MKTLKASLLAAGLLGLAVGCNTHSTPGGPGATSTTGDKMQLGTPDNAFKLDMPTLSTTVKQGERKVVDVGIKRGKNFDQDVKLEVSGEPKGLKVTLDNPVIKAGESTTKLNVEADKEAPLGDHEITVKATPAKDGPAASSTYKIKIDKP